MKYMIGIILGLVIVQNDYVQEIKDWQNEMNTEFADPEESPLEKRDLKKFESLEFYPIDEKYRVTATLTLTPNEMPFHMPTTTSRLPIYVKYGILKFELDGNEYQLSIYKNDAISMREGYEDYLFLPFTDQTNGLESYGGGRYLDMRIPQGDSIVIDFNKAYNPYCAYNGKYSCPIPPRENDLAVEIRAGVKAWKDH